MTQKLSRTTDKDIENTERYFEEGTSKTTNSKTKVQQRQSNLKVIILITNSVITYCPSKKNIFVENWIVEHVKESFKEVTN